MSNNKLSENTEIRKITYNKALNCYVSVIPKQFVEEHNLAGYVKVTLLEDGKLIMEKLGL